MPPETPENTEFEIPTETLTFNKSDINHKADISSSHDKPSTSIKYEDDISVSPDVKISKVCLPHILDLSATPKGLLPKSLENVPLLYPTASYSIYLVRVVQHLFLTIIFDWTTIITHPVNSLLIFALFPAAAILLFVLECILRIVNHFKLYSNDSNDEAVIETWSKLTPSHLRSQLLKNLHLGMKSLDDPLSPDNNRFNLNQAQFLLFLSAILQGRDGDKVLVAYNLLSNMKSSLEKEKDANIDNNSQLQEVYKILKESEEGICKQIKEFNLQYTSLSELNTLGGPYAGMFWSEERNFIVIALKGTTPTNFSEWLTNATFQRVDARPYLFGEIHEGFYTQLFPADEYTSERLNRSCPATRITEAVRRLGKTIREQNMNKSNKSENTPLVNVYVTGHSLGGALASLLYGRLLISPQSLGEHCVLRDGKTFASPSVGDNDFSAEFSSLCNRSVDEYKTLWRVVCDNDIVPRVPPGHHYPSLRKYTSKVHILNYFHVGDEVRFYQDGTQPSSMRDIFGHHKELLFLDHGLDWNNWKSLFGFYDPFDHVKHEKNSYDPIYDKKVEFGDSLFNFVRNHSAHRYYAALEKSREFFEEADKNVKGKLL